MRLMRMRRMILTSACFKQCDEADSGLQLRSES